MFGACSGMFLALVGHATPHACAEFSVLLCTLFVFSRTFTHVFMVITPVQLGGIFHILALYIFVLGEPLLSVTVRVLFHVPRFGVVLASMGHITHTSGAAVQEF